MPQVLTSTITTSDNNEEWRVKNVSTTPYAVAVGETFISVDATSGAITINLPTAAGENKNRVIIVKKNDNVNNVTVDGNGSQTLDGSLTKVLTTQYEVLRLISDGSNWKVW